VSFGGNDGAAAGIRTHLPALGGGTGSGEDTDPETAAGGAGKKGTGGLHSVSEGKGKKAGKEGKKIKAASTKK
jgi:hypothetical protein